MPAAPQSNSTVIHKLADCVSLHCMVVNKTTLAVFFATRHPFFSSSISCLVHQPASRECPYPRSAGKVNALCDRTTFFIQPPYTLWSHLYTHSCIISIAANQALFMKALSFLLSWRTYPAQLIDFELLYEESLIAAFIDLYMLELF